MTQAQFQNGKWAFQATGTIYYVQLRKGVVWLWKGAGITAYNYCGTRALDQFLVDFTKV